MLDTKAIERSPHSGKVNATDAVLLFVSMVCGRSRRLIRGAIVLANNRSAADAPHFRQEDIVQDGQ
jgi:hypothetical protein